MNDVLVAGLESPLAAMGVDLESIEVSKAGRRHVVRIVIDRDGGVDLDTVADVSRAVSELLDTEPLASVLPGPFVLEVTSPGVDRPLTHERHWRRAASRLVIVTMRDGSHVTGRVVEATSSDLALRVDDGVVRYPWSNVDHGQVQVEFAKFGESAEAAPDLALDVTADLGVGDDEGEV
jgi:ribosome maturation factor RimP